jgi:hypothetical protein
LVVHHAKKGASHERAGQALRGSSEFHAWLDSGLFLQRKSNRLQLSFEHRSQQALAPMPLKLFSHEKSIALLIDENSSTPSAENPSSPSMSPQDRLISILSASTTPLTTKQLRKTSHMRTATLCTLLNQIEAKKIAVRSAQGWSINKQSLSQIEHSSQLASPITASQNP